VSNRSPLLAAALCAALALAAAGCAHRAPAAGSDVLYLERGDEIVGRLQSVDAGQVVFRSRDGDTASRPLEQVQRVELAPPAGASPTLAGLGDPELADWIKTAPSAADLPDYGTVTLFQETRLTYRADGGLRRVYRDVTKILNEKGKDAGNWSDFYLADVQRWRLLHARSIAPDGTVRELPHTAMKESSPNAAYPAYDRRRDVTFAVPNAEPGSVIDVAYVLEQETDPADQPAVANFTFAAWSPVLRRRVVFDAPATGGPVVRSWFLTQGEAWARMLQGGKQIYDRPPEGTVHVSSRRDGDRIVTT
jgi:hypothetical protein